MGQDKLLTPFQMVKQFHRAFGHPVADKPGFPSHGRIKFRRDRIEEEHTEWLTALHNIGCGRSYVESLIEIADALGDMVYVIYGTAVEFGIDLDAVVEEIHRSNMAKLDENGQPIYRSDGKIQKPKGWQPPDLKGALGL